MNSDPLVAIKLGRLAKVRFNILAVGEGGLGKTTFLKSLSRTYSKHITQRFQIGEKVSTEPIKNSEVIIKECERFILTSEMWDCEVRMLETPGFGDYIDNTGSISVIKKYIEKSHQNWCHLNCNNVTDEERNQSDDRVHCIFYFVHPHKIKELDTMFFRELRELAVIVPIVPKSDTMTISERQFFLLELQSHVKSLKHELGDVIFDFEERVDSSSTEFQRAQPDSYSQCIDAKLDEVQSQTRKLSQVDEEADALLVSRISIADFTDSELYRQSSLASQATIEGDEIDYSHAFESRLLSDSEVTSSTFSIYPQPFPTSLNCHDDSLAKVPNIFAIICIDREYSWGSVSALDENRSDFRRLLRLLFESEKIALMREVTQKKSIAFSRKHRKATTSAWLSEFCSEYYLFATRIGEWFAKTSLHHYKEKEQEKSVIAAMFLIFFASPFVLVIVSEIVFWATPVQSCC